MDQKYDLMAGHQDGTKTDWLSFGGPTLFSNTGIIWWNQTKALFGSFVENLWIWFGSPKRLRLWSESSLWKSRVGFFGNRKSFRKFKTRLMLTVTKGWKSCRAIFWHGSRNSSKQFRPCITGGNSEELRPDYVQGLTDLMSPGSRLLLICVDYDPSKNVRPPYIVSQNEVVQSFSKKGTLKCLKPEITWKTGCGEDWIGLMKRSTYSKRQSLSLIWFHAWAAKRWTGQFCFCWKSWKIWFIPVHLPETFAGACDAVGFAHSIHDPSPDISSSKAASWSIRYKLK